MKKLLFVSLSLIFLVSCSEPNISNTILNNTWYGVNQDGQLLSFKFKEQTLQVTEMSDCSDSSTPDGTITISVPNDSTIILNIQDQQSIGVSVPSITENSFIMSYPNQPSMTFLSDCSLNE